MKAIKASSKSTQLSVNVSDYELHRPSSDVRHKMIEKAAYYSACSRGFDRCDMLGDWLTAEKRVDSILDI